MRDRYGRNRYDRYDREDDYEGRRRSRSTERGDSGDIGWSPNYDRSESYFGGGRGGMSYGSGYTGTSYETGPGNYRGDFEGGSYERDEPTYRDRYHRTGEWASDRGRYNEFPREEPRRYSRYDRPSSESGYDYNISGRYGRERDRGWWDKTSDEVASWFGDDDAERRRERDERYAENHRGRGPSGYKRSDERIKEDVNDRLTDSPHLDATDIQVDVSDSEVTLSGRVNSRYEKRLAEDIAENVSAVTNVENRIRVNKNVTMSESSAHGTAGTANYSNSSESTLSRTKTA